MASSHLSDSNHQEQLRLLVEEVKEYAIFMLDPEGHITTWNEGAERIKGYTEEEILGTHFSTFYPEEAVEAGRPEEGLETAAREGQWIDEGWRVRKDGSRFWARVTITALYDDEGQVRGFGKVTRDLTERRRKELELETQKRQAERENNLLRLLQIVSEAANDADSLKDAAQQTVDAVCEHLDWPVGHVYWVHEDEEPRLKASGVWHIDAPGRFERFRDVSETVRFAVEESVPGYVAGTGRPHWIRDVTDAPRAIRTEGEMDLGVKGGFAVPVQVEGETVAVLEFYSEVEEELDEELLEAMESVGVQLSQVAVRERAQAVLRESEAKFRALAEQSIVGIELIQDGVYQYVNPTFAEYFGYDPEELLGRSPEVVFHPEDWPKVQAAIRQRLAGEEREARFTARGQTRDGDTVYLEVYGRRIDYQGRPAIVGTSLDVTERRRLEEELLQVQDEERQRLGQELHDGVCSLLTAAGIMASRLADDLGDDTPVTQEPVTQEDVEKMHEYIQQATDEARALSHGLTPVKLEGDLLYALEKLSSRAEVRGELSCSFEASGTVPELPTDTATHLYRIAQEAVNNAIKHADAQHIQVHLAAGDDGTLELEVRDDGRGYTSAASNEEEGLGMRTMRRRANLIGGVLTVEEATEEGTLVRCQMRAPAREEKAASTS